MCGKVLDQHVVHPALCDAGATKLRTQNALKFVLAQELRAAGAFVDRRRMQGPRPLQTIRKWRATSSSNGLGLAAATSYASQLGARTQCATPTQRPNFASPQPQEIKTGVTTLALQSHLSPSFFAVLAKAHASALPTLQQMRADLGKPALCVC